jgi:hypothetical protein
MQDIGFVCALLAFVGVAVFLHAHPIFILWLVALCVLGFAARFWRDRLSNGMGSTWFNSALILVGALTGTAFLSITVYWHTGEMPLDFVGITLVAGAVIAFMNWGFDWPEKAADFEILGDFVFIAAVTAFALNYLAASFALPGTQPSLLNLFWLSAIEGTILGIGSCCMQRVFGVNPRRDFGFVG